MIHIQLDSICMKFPLSLHETAAVLYVIYFLIRNICLQLQLFSAVTNRSFIQVAFCSYRTNILQLPYCPFLSKFCSDWSQVHFDPWTSWIPFPFSIYVDMEAFIHLSQLPSERNFQQLIKIQPNVVQYINMANDGMRRIFIHSKWRFNWKKTKCSQNSQL